MGNHALLLVATLTAYVVWLAIKYAIATHHSMQQLRIAAHGIGCKGRVVSIQRPFLLDHCTRLYFDYVPEGADHPLRACHIHRPSHDVTQAPLPAAGAVVSVHYLPDHPRQAVIRKLVA